MKSSWEEFGWGLRREGQRGFKFWPPPLLVATGGGGRRGPNHLASRQPGVGDSGMAHGLPMSHYCGDTEAKEAV